MDDDILDLEPVDELEELVDEVDSEPVETVDVDKICGVAHWIKFYGDVVAPGLIVDANLKIIWRNKAFSTLFEKESPLAGEYLTRIFYSDSENSAVVEIFRSLKSAETGFSWQGRVVTRSRIHKTIVSHLILTPVFDVENPEVPVVYTGIVFDFTEEHNQLIRTPYLSLLEASKLKDNDTGNHIYRVNAYALVMAEAIYKNPRYPQIDRDFLDNIGFLAAMHDVGKIGTPDDILNKQGPLNDWEWDIMKEHTINGAFILSNYPNPMAKEIAISHHEKWDGSGYPYGLDGEMVPLSARIVAICDVYDALRMKRSYKPPYPHDEAIERIKEGTGKHFDPNLIEVMLGIHTKFKEIFDKMYDSGDADVKGDSFFPADY